MQTMSEVYFHINSEYNKLQNEHKQSIENSKQFLYEKFPRIEEIDNEISMLAINSARRVIEENLSPEEATLAMKKRAEILNQEKENILKDNDYSEFSPRYNCVLCKDTGFRENGKKCRCYMEKLSNLVSFPGDSSNGDKEFFKSAVFDNFKLSYYSNEVDVVCGSSPRKIMKMNLAKCVKFANEFSGINSGNILLYGPSGLGKSFMAGCIYNRVTDNGYFAIYKSSYKLFQFLEDYKFGRIDRDKYNLANNSVYDCDLLIIDDFGTEFITSYTQSVFFDLLNTRLMNGKSTIISTNLNSDELKKIYQERVCSRLENEFVNLLFCGSDIRSLKNN